MGTEAQEPAEFHRHKAWSEFRGIPGSTLHLVVDETDQCAEVVLELCPSLLIPACCWVGLAQLTLFNGSDGGGQQARLLN